MELISNIKIAKDIYEMKLKTNWEEVKAGQFVEVDLPGLFLRRPISVCDFNNGVLTLVFKVVGKGTLAMSKLTKGQDIDIIGPFGNGYNIEEIKNNALLIGGGVGIPPMYYLAKKIINKGNNCKVLLGFNNKEDVFYVDHFKELGLEVEATTVDGTEYKKGFVTDLFDQSEYVCSCGPLVMMNKIRKKAKTGQYSFEARMGCGFGACMGCSIETKNGMKRVCKEGPVFKQEEIIW